MPVTGVFRGKDADRAKVISRFKRDIKIKRMGEYTGKSYQPSNGTEGEWFIEEYCMNCINCDPDPNGPKQCKILCATMCFSVGEKGYPEEWVYDDNDEPSCTAWVKWDWGNDGDPDDQDNPKRPIPEDPNQLCLPFLLEEIGVKTKELLPISKPLLIQTMITK